MRAAARAYLKVACCETGGCKVWFFTSSLYSYIERLRPLNTQSLRGQWHGIKREGTPLKCHKVTAETVCAGDTVLVDLNYLPELPSRSVDGVATMCFFSVLGPRSEHTSCVPVN